MRLPLNPALPAPRTIKRRPTRLRLERLDQRITPASHSDCTIKVVSGHILQITGTEQKDVISISQESDGIRVICNGHDPQTFKGIDQFLLYARGGDDVVNLDFAPGGFDSVWIDLGLGNDILDGSMVPPTWWEPEGPASTQFSVRGGGGFDTISIFAFNPQPEPPIYLLLDVQGGTGDDFINVDFNGAVTNQLAVSADGGDGADFIRCHAAMKISASANAQMKIVGGGGTDFFEIDLGDSDVFGRFKLDARGGLGSDVTALNAFGLNFMPGSDTQIVILGDAGDDQVFARHKFTSEGRFRLDAQGGLGDDLLYVDGAELDLMPGSDTQIAIRGDSGEDQVGLHFKFTSEGAFRLDALGGLGNDLLSVEGVELNFMPNSSTRIAMNGEAGEDRINFFGKKIHSEGAFDISTLGGLGNDAVMIEEEEIALLPGSSTRITSNGEAGDDYMSIRLKDLVSAQSVRLEALGGFGRDVVSVEGVGLNFLPNSQTTFQVRGDAGDDQLNFRIHKHTSEGSFGLSALGGDGNDWIAVDGVGLNFMPSANVQLKISGDAGNDRTRFGLFDLVSHGIFGLEQMGGLGNDAMSIELNSQKVKTAVVKVDAGDGADQINIDFAANIGDWTFEVNCGTGDDAAQVRMLKLPLLPGENPGKQMGHFTMDGGAGHDILSAEFSGDASAQKTNLFASLLGGKGDDKMRLVWSAAFDANASADGGAGVDVGLFPPPVKTSNLELIR